MGLSLKLQNPDALSGAASHVEMIGQTLSIGRGGENDFVLADPDRTLSKRHCVVEERNGDYVIIDISTNGTFLNYGTERLDNSPTPLNDGDVIVLGSFELVVEITDGASKVAARPAVDVPLPPLDDAPTSPDMMSSAIAPQAPSGTLDDLIDNDGGGDFLDDLLGGPSEPRQSSAASSTSDMMVPDDILGPSDPFSSDMPQGSSASNHSPAAQDYFSPPATSKPMIPDDWADSLIQPAASPTRPVVSDDPFGGVTEPPVAPPAQPTQPAPAAPSDAALRAFLEGAGATHIDIPAAEVVETMARMGRVMAAMIEGMRDILMTRASIKSEMRMDRTMINAGGNNPLKFSISVEQAVEAMIKPSVRGYIEAEAAVTEALTDVKAHEVATMSGMEAALKDLLGRLSPQELSARIEAGSSLGNLLGGKKARYWEAYEKMYAQIAKETEDDFQSAFGREFTRAYEEQVKKL